MMKGFLAYISSDARAFIKQGIYMTVFVEVAMGIGYLLHPFDETYIFLIAPLYVAVIIFILWIPVLLSQYRKYKKWKKTTWK